MNLVKHTAVALTAAGLLTALAAGTADAKPMQSQVCHRDRDVTCATSQWPAAGGTIYLDYNLQGGGNAQELKIIANGTDLAGCVYYNAVHAPASGTIACHLPGNSEVVAYVRMQNAGDISVGWHQ